MMATQQTVAFRDADFSSFQGSGSANISGEAFVTLSDGDSVEANAVEVRLTPATPYTEERFNIIGSGRSVADPDPGLATYVRATTTDQYGHFRFRDIPPGKYYLTASVSWQQPSQYSLHGMDTRSKDVITSAEAVPETTTKVDLTN